MGTQEIELEEGIALQITADRVGVSVEKYAGHYDSEAKAGDRAIYAERVPADLTERIGQGWHLVSTYDGNGFHKGYATLHESMFTPVSCEQRWGYPELKGEAVHNCSRGKEHKQPHRCACGSESS